MKTHYHLGQESISTPEFKSAIPEHLLEGAKASERHMLETLSRLEQQTTWMTEQLVALSDRILELESRLRPIEKWKDLLFNRWTAIPVIITLAGLLDMLVRYFQGKK